MSTYLADNAADIAKRWAEIQEEKRQAIMGKPLEDPTPAVKPETVDIGWPYGVYTSGYQNALNYPTPDFRSLYNNACQEIASRNAKD